MDNSNNNCDVIRHCVYCKYGHYKLMRLFCDKYPTERKHCASSCPEFTPTSEPIEKRSLS